MEIAALFFAGISAALAAVQVWQATRNQGAAAQAFDDEFKSAISSPETQQAAVELLSVAPTEVIADLESRAEACWTGYRKVLSGPFLPDEIDNATVAVKACVCRELGRIHDLNAGHIPDKWQEQWNAYDCWAMARGQPGSVRV